MKLIITKYLKGKTNKLEEKELYNWLSNDDSNVRIFKKKIAFYMLAYSTNETVNIQEVFEEFKEKISKKKSGQIPFLPYKKYYKYAAVVTILIASIISVYIINNDITAKSKQTNQVSKSIKFNNIFNKEIILTLEDGSTKILEQKQEELSYFNSSYLKPSSSKEVLAYNEIKVPKGQVFRLVLSDSTVVWLNADTKLRYPKKFINSLKTRSVELEGEAFFDVAHNKDKPFIVNTDGVYVKVLGTKFNISSYNGEDYINTTVVEGAVNVVDINDNNNYIIVKPNFQASFQNNNTSLTSKEVNTLDYTAWIEKRIIFNDTPFERLVTKIERTYNVKIINKNKILKKEHFTGQFDIENIETIFKALSASFYFDYKIKNNTITIKEQVYDLK